MKGLRTVLVLAVLAAALALPGIASAHASLVRSDPPANSALAKAPSTVRLTFS